MLTVEDLKKRIQSTESLQSVVKTMKVLAAVNIRQYEKAVESLEEYNKAVEMGLRVTLRNRGDLIPRAKETSMERLGAIVFGSDQGMCGPLNDQVVSHALETLDGRKIKERDILAVGERATARLEEAGQPVEFTFSVPGSVAGITPRVQDLLVAIERWNTEQKLDQVLLFYSKPAGGASTRPHRVHLLPVDRQWLDAMQDRPWPTRALPMFTMDWAPLFSALIREYLFVSLFRAFAESMASENASRLSSMQAAERHIEEHLGELRFQFHRERQRTITEELLDIVSGSEALTEKIN